MVGSPLIGCGPGPSLTNLEGFTRRDARRLDDLPINRLRRLKAVILFSDQVEKWMDRRAKQEREDKLSG